MQSDEDQATIDLEPSRFDSSMAPKINETIAHFSTLEAEKKRVNTRQFKSRAAETKHESELDGDNRPRKKSKRDDPDIGIMSLPSDEQPRQIARQRQDNSEERKDRPSRRDRNREKKTLKTVGKKDSGMGRTESELSPTRRRSIRPLSSNHSRSNYEYRPQSSSSKGFGQRQRTFVKASESELDSLNMQTRRIQTKVLDRLSPRDKEMSDREGRHQKRGSVEENDEGDGMN